MRIRRAALVRAMAGRRVNPRGHIGIVGLRSRARRNRTASPLSASPVADAAPPMLRRTQTATFSTSRDSESQSRLGRQHPSRATQPPRPVGRCESERRSGRSDERRNFWETEGRERGGSPCLVSAALTADRWAAICLTINPIESAHLASPTLPPSQPCVTAGSKRERVGVLCL